MKLFQNRDFIIRDLAALCLICETLYWMMPFPLKVWRLGLVGIALYVILFKKKSRLLQCEKSISAFLLLNIVYFVFVVVTGIHVSTTQLGNALCSLFSFGLFVYLGEKKVMTDKFFMVMGAILVLASILRYNFDQISIYQRRGVDGDVDVTNGGSVYFLMILPMLFLFKNSIQRWGTLLICIYFIALGAKRGNIVSATIPIVIFVWNELRGAKRSGLKFFIVIIAIVASVLVVEQWVLSNDYLLYRAERTVEGDSSGRDVLYVNAWNGWLNSNNLLRYLFGFGYNGIVRLPEMNGMHAHNDWLEILVNYGLLGITMYIAIFISLVLYINQIQDKQKKLVVITVLIIWFSKSLYSMGYLTSTLSWALMTIGGIIGNQKRQSSTVYIES